MITNTIIITKPWCRIRFDITSRKQNKREELVGNLGKYPKTYGDGHGRKSGGGGGGQGDMSPPPRTILKVRGQHIKCPPRFWGWMIINWNEDPFFMWALRRCGLFFFFLLVIEVCDVRWVPLLCVWKIEPNILRLEKCWSPPPPPPPMIRFFALLVTAPVCCGFYNADL